MCAISETMIAIASPWASAIARRLPLPVAMIVPAPKKMSANVPMNSANAACPVLSTGPSLSERRRSDGTLTEGTTPGKADEGAVVACPVVDVVLVSLDARSRELMALTVRSIERRLGQELRFRAAANGDLGTRVALRDRPEI